MGDGGSLILLGGATYSRVEAGECERREKILFGYIGSFQLLESPGIVEPPPSTHCSQTFSIESLGECVALRFFFFFPSNKVFQVPSPLRSSFFFVNWEESAGSSITFFGRHTSFLPELLKAPSFYPRGSLFFVLFPNLDSFFDFYFIYFVFEKEFFVCFSSIFVCVCVCSLSVCCSGYWTLESGAVN